MREQKRDSLRLVLREIDVGDDEEEPGEGVLLAGVACSNSCSLQGVRSFVLGKDGKDLV